jgi:hypothetical protein
MDLIGPLFIQLEILETILIFLGRESGAASLLRLRLFRREEGESINAGAGGAAPGAGAGGTSAGI